MKNTKHYQFIAFVTVSVFALGAPGSMAQTANQRALLQLEEKGKKLKTPETTEGKIAAMEERHQKAFSELSENLKQIYTKPGYLGSKDQSKLVSESTKEMKAIHTDCKTLLTSLRAEAKEIESSTVLSDEQKQELLESSGSLVESSDELEQKLDLAISRLAVADKYFSDSVAVHKSYASLKGEAKANEVIKTHVEKYLKSFAKEQDESEGVLQDSDDADKKES